MLLYAFYWQKKQLTENELQWLLHI